MKLPLFYWFSFQYSLINYLEWVGLFSFAQLLVDQKFFLCKRHKTQKIKEYMKSVLFYFSLPCIWTYVWIINISEKSWMKHNTENEFSP